MDSVEEAIRLRAWGYVRGELSRDEFMDWFAPLVMDDLSGAEPAVVELANDVIALDAGYTSGAGSEEDFKDLLRQRLHIYRGDLVGTWNAARVVTGSSNVSNPAGTSLIAAGQ